MNPTITIRTPQHYTALLIDPNPSVRREALALLIQGNPDALRFARAEGSQALEALTGQLESSVSSDDDLDLVRALNQLDDARASDDFVRVLMYSERPEALELAAAALARWGKHAHWLGQALFDPHRPHLHRLAAPHLPEGASERELVRAALVQVASNDLDPFTAPGFDRPEHANSYAQELRGPYAATVRRIAEAHGQAAFAALETGFARLAPADQAWLVAWGGRLRSLPAVNLIDRLLANEHTPPELLAAALQATVALGPLASALSGRIERLANEPATATRAASDDFSELLAAASSAARGVSA